MDRNSTILIIESDPELLDLISISLGRRYRIVKANNPDNVLDVLSENAVDMILSDRPVAGMKQPFMSHDTKAFFVTIPPVLPTGYVEIRSFIRMIQEVDPEKDMSSISAQMEIACIVMDVLYAHLTLQQDNNEKNKAILEKVGRMATLGELLPGIVHEIGNPLSFIRSNLVNSKKMISKLLSFIDDFDKLPVSDMVKTTILEQKKTINYDYLINRLMEIVESSQSGVERVTTVLNDVRRVSKSSITEKFVKADINLAIETTLNIMRSEFKNRVTVEKILGRLPEVECHSGQINQVLMNILINAGHAIENEGRILIVTRVLSAGRIIIEISDTGKGIAEADMKRIFEPFFTTKPEGIGTGLGLSISRDIIEKHHGEIKIISPPGQGTTVAVILPVTQ